MITLRLFSLFVNELFLEWRVVFMLFCLRKSRLLFTDVLGLRVIQVCGTPLTCIDFFNDDLQVRWFLIFSICSPKVFKLSSNYLLFDSQYNYLLTIILRRVFHFAEFLHVSLVRKILKGAARWEAGYLASRGRYCWCVIKLRGFGIVGQDGFNFYGHNR